MKKPPQKVQILGKTYTLTPAPGLIADDESTGNCVTARCKIQYDPDQAPDCLRDTILHETLHGVFSEMGLGEHFDSKQEELLVRGLATGLLDTLRRNKPFAKYLLE